MYNYSNKTNFASSQESSCEEVVQERRRSKGGEWCRDGGAEVVQVQRRVQVQRCRGAEMKRLC